MINDHSSNSHSVNECILSVFFQNCNGFVNKRMNLLNSSILVNNQIIILQESNLDSKRHSHFLDFSSQDFTALNLSSVNDGRFVRGCLLAYKNNIKLPNPHILNQNFLLKNSIFAALFFLSPQLLLILYHVTAVQPMK